MFAYRGLGGPKFGPQIHLVGRQASEVKILPVLKQAYEAKRVATRRQQTDLNFNLGWVEQTA